MSVRRSSCSLLSAQPAVAVALEAAKSKRPKASRSRAGGEHTGRVCLPPQSLSIRAAAGQSRLQGTPGEWILHAFLRLGARTSPGPAESTRAGRQRDRYLPPSPLPVAEERAPGRSHHTGSKYRLQWRMMSSSDAQHTFPGLVLVRRTAIAPRPGPHGRQVIFVFHRRHEVVPVQVGGQDILVPGRA